VDNEDPAANAEHLLDLAGDEEYGHALGGHLVERRMNGSLGRDVDASSRLIDDQDGRLDFARSPEEDLLLVAARQRADRLADRGEAQVDSPGELGRWRLEG